MTVPWIILGILAAAAVASYIDLFLIGGTPINTPVGRWEVRMRSWWPRLLGHDGFTVGQCSHFRPGHAPSGVLCAHEHFHTTQHLGPLEMLHYVVSPSYRLAIETPAKAYGAAHGSEPGWLAVAAQLANLA